MDLVFGSWAFDRIAYDVIPNFQRMDNIDLLVIT